MWGQLRHYFSLACPKVHVFSRSRELDLIQRNRRLTGEYLIGPFAGSCVSFASPRRTPNHGSAPPGQVTWAPRVPPAVIGPPNGASTRALYFPRLESQVLTMDFSKLEPFEAEEDAPTISRNTRGGSQRVRSPEHLEHQPSNAQINGWKNVFCP